jgi:sphingolipid 8-(E)-desaturase
MLVDAAAGFLLKVQHKLYYLVMSLARFNLYANSYGFLMKNAFKTSRPFSARWTYCLEISFIAIFWVWYTAVLRGCGSWGNIVAFLLISNVVPSPLHVQVRHKYLLGII